MKTKSEKVIGPVSVWAIPYDSYHMENDPNSEPFYYKISIYSPYMDGAVKIMETEITLEIPEGIDLFDLSVKELKEKQSKVRATAQVEVDKIQNKINRLTVIEHKPTLEEVVRDATDQEHFDEGVTTIVERGDDIASGKWIDTE